MKKYFESQKFDSLGYKYYMEEVGITSTENSSILKLSVHRITEEELEIFGEGWDFVRMAPSMPVFKKV